MRHFLLALLALMTALTCTARDNHRYRMMTMDDGLPSNAVRNIVQDRQGFIWLGTDNGLCRYDGTRIQYYRIDELGMNQYVSALLVADEGIYAGTEKGVFLLRGDKVERLPMDIHSTVTSLTADKEGRLWVGTQSQGAWCMADGQARQYSFDHVRGIVSQVFVDSDNRIWAVSNSVGHPLSQLNRLHDRFEPLTLSGHDRCNALCMTQTADGRLWLGSWEDGLLLLHSDGRVEQMLSSEQTKMGLHIHTLLERSDDCLCIGCDDGIICYNPVTGEWHRGLDSDTPDQRFVYSIISDAEGGVWMGTFYGGVCYFSPVGQRFQVFSRETGLSGNVISRFCEDRQGRIWIASDDGGLMCYNPRDQRLTDYPGRAQLQECNTHALCLDAKENLWIGTYTDGVVLMNTTTGQLKHYTETDDPHSLDNSSSYAIFCDSQSRVWVATMDGLNLYDEPNDRFIRIGKLHAMTTDIDEDHQGRLWLSTQGGGLWRYDHKTGKLQQYRYDDKDAHSLPDDQVNSAIVDESGQLWVGTLGGLCKYDADSDTFERMHLDVSTQNVLAIVESDGALWLTTDRGIVKYVPGEGIQLFTRQDGLVGEQAQPNAAMKASDGQIYVGTTSGFSTFRPSVIKVNSVMPPVYITSMSILNHEEYTAEGLPLDISLTRDIVIGHGDNRMVTFSFASLSYCSPEKNQYAYRLEGFDRDWNYVGNQTKATYTNLPAGNYTLHVKATNNDGVWSVHEATLQIEVRPPFWWSWWAKLIYVLLLGTAIWWYVHYRLRKAERKHQQEIQRLSEEKEREARDARLKFFTMVAHEIRTPVSLIIGPLEKLSDEVKSNASLKVIDRNAHRLLELINQLLDFRKVEQQMLVVNPAPTNIRALLQAVCERFAPTIEQGGRQFTAEYPDEHFTAIVDGEAITKVVSNLLTNAIKYTKSSVSLRCLVEPDDAHFRITVSDDGVGIREADLEHIFEPFFQAQAGKPGTGIGLSIVKNIVDLHHGTISVDSEVGRGSTFTVVLPVGAMLSALSSEREAPAARESALPSERSHGGGVSPFNVHRAEGSSLQASPSTILVVDDSEDMVTFLSDSLQNNYHVITARDGIEALHQLSNHHFGLIVSDWMMPGMDGAELCRQVRRNPLTSHIPFIMLTAKTDDDSKVKGMDLGVDAYIEKPFSVQYLDACIRNIMAIRRQLFEKFSSEPFIPASDMASNDADNEFLSKMVKIIENNIANSDLSVNFLAEELGISRSGLFAKIKSLADVTPNEMIQVVRLKRAAVLLREGKYLISEVCYKVGFSNPSYFSKCFQKQFGIKPADFVKNNN